MMAIATDNEDESSNERDSRSKKTFSILNPPKIAEATMNDTFITPDTEGVVTITGILEDIDDGKPIYIYCNDGDISENYTWASRAAYTSFNSNGSKRQDFRFEYRIQTKAGMNVPIRIWADKDETSVNSKNDKSREQFIILVNISDPPKATTYQYPEEHYYNSIDTFKLSATISDESKGTFKFFLDGNDMKIDEPYEVDKSVPPSSTGDYNYHLDKTIAIPENCKYEGLKKHTIEFYPIDEFNLTSTSKGKFDFYVINPPTLKDVHLSKTRVTKDDDLTVTGKIKDIDSEKPLYIYSQIGDDVSTRKFITKMSNPKSDIDFDFKVDAIKRKQSGEYDLKVWVSASDDQTKLNRYSNSETYSEPIANNISITVDYPNQEIFATAETITVRVQVTDTDLDGDIYYKLDGQQAFEKDHFITEQTFTKEFNTEQNPIGFGKHKIVIYVEGRLGVSTAEYPFEFNVKNKPNLITATPKVDMVDPGKDFDVDITFDDKDNTKPLYLFAKIGNGNAVNYPLSSNSNGSNGQKSKVSIRADGAKGNQSITVWLADSIQIADHAKSNSRSDDRTFYMMITLAPTVSLVKTGEIKGSKDQEITIQVKIVDDTEGECILYVNNEPVDQTHYKTESGQKVVDFKLRLDQQKYKYPNKYTITAGAIDEFGVAKNSSNFATLVISNRLKYVDFKMGPAIQNDRKIPFTIKFTDYDEGKKLKLFFQIDSSPYTYNQIITSNGTENQVHEGIFDVPTSAFLYPGNNPIYYTLDEKSAYNNAQEYTLYVTFRPSITLNDLTQKEVKTKENLVLNGKVSGDKKVNITAIVTNNGDQRKFAIATNYKVEKLANNFNFPFEIPQELTYMSTPYTIMLHVVDNNQFTSDSFPKEFTVKNPPTLAITNIEKANGMLSGEKIIVTGTVTDIDPEKNVYIIINGRIMNQILPITQKDTPAEFNYEYTVESENYGTVNIEIYASDLKSSKNSFSNKETTSVYVTIKPTCVVTYPDVKFFNSQNPIGVTYRIKDDTTGSIKYKIGNTEIENSKSTYTSNNVEVSDSTTISLPGSYVYGNDYDLSIYTVDEFSKESDAKNNFKFSIRNKPEIVSATLNNDKLLMSNQAKITGKFNDQDTNKPLHFFAQINDGTNIIRYDTKESRGSNNQDFLMNIPVDDRFHYGENTIKLIVNDNEDASVQVSDYSKSIFAEELKLLVTFTPEINPRFTEKEVYIEGEKITVEGNVKSRKTIDLEFFIDSTSIGHISSIESNEAEKDFSIDITIPDGLEYGEHSLTIVGKDTDELGFSENPKKRFYIKHAPTISKITVDKENVIQGTKFVIKGTACDKDVGKEIEIIVKFAEHDEESLKTFVSDASDQEFEIEITVPGNEDVGEKQILAYVKDNDGMKSDVETATINVIYPDRTPIETPQETPAITPSETEKVTPGLDKNEDPNKQNEKKSSKGSKGRLIAGIVIAVIALIALTIVAVILFLKKKQAGQDKSSSDDDEFELQEETIFAPTNPSQEITTMDNPLFTSCNESNSFSVTDDDNNDDCGQQYVFSNA
ncbi:Bap-like [Trichomonas vaginalis G3]|uniref:Bap-like n=1 Tax=Trichomonas vaginalis (strain ATCC PRA-98 / G3) TaxID=412133 RepID=A2DFU4_TRIV3|nr:glycoprotein 38 family [Trichomonas vaginalis G3]EAY20797.1 Bap-like [Trichomonas vaginalis G3]KAI5529411.1 glycoprotein 38 family [Trichomonas vaginalis G3]|eukprot:XP_001581783.1 Bap-like [Trichomonas vaginalis G3]